MTWFLEKQEDLLVCEIRKIDNESVYEYEIAYAKGPVTHRFVSPADLIAKHLNEQARLIADGWRPRHIQATE